MEKKKRRVRKPDWFKVTYDSEVGVVGQMMEDDSLHTVCKEANCPNRGECYKKRTVTFMIMGNQCSRNCKFCNVKSGEPMHLDPLEPLHVAQSVQKLNLKHVVITSVTRDDLEDGGANHFAKTIEEVKKLNPGVTVEVLIPDLKGEDKNLDIIINAKPDVINHNMSHPTFNTSSISLYISSSLSPSPTIIPVFVRISGAFSFTYFNTYKDLSYMASGLTFSYNLSIVSIL